MDRLKRIASVLMSSTLFWVLLILGAMVVFIMLYEKPAVVNLRYDPY